MNMRFLPHVYQHSRAVGVAVHAQKAGRQVRAALQRLGDPRASIEEIAREAGLRTSAVAAVRRREFRVCSLDAALYPYGGTRTLADDLARPQDEDARGFDLAEASIATRIAAALAQLNPRARHVVELRFGIGCPRQHCYSEIAAELGVSMERARQIAVQALSRVRSARLRRGFERMVG